MQLSAAKKVISPVMTKLVLHLTGPFRLIGVDGSLLGGLSRRAQGMLAYLACQPRYLAERSTLADLLWSDRTEAQARASLRQELSVLRGHLPSGALEADRQTVWLNASHFSFERDNGAFLQGFDLPSEGFEDWLRLERAASEHDVSSTHSEPKALPREIPSLAVMPFDELDTDGKGILAVGIVEEITGALSRVGAFHVIARQSAFALEKKNLTAQEAAEILRTDYLIEGSVQRSDDKVRISVQLVRGHDGYTLWSRRFDDRLDDLFDMQDRITAQVAGQLAPNLRAAEITRASHQPPGDRSAYELTLTALPHFWVHDAADNDLAVSFLDAAITKAPDYGLAVALRSWCHAHRCCYLWAPEPEIARQAARRDFEAALPLVPDHAPALTALSASAALALHDFVLADQLARRALEIDPNNAWAWLRLGWTSSYLGRPEEALGHFDRAEALSPLDPFHFNIEFGRAACLRSLKDFDASVALVQKGLREAPKAVWAYRMLFGALWLKGDKAGALEAGRKWRAAFPGLDKRTLLEGLPPWRHDPDYLDLLHRFDELIPSK